MSRRLFLERAVALIGTSVVTPAVRAAVSGDSGDVMGGKATLAARPAAPSSGPAASSPSPDVQDAPAIRGQVELQRSPVAGFQYHQGETIWPLLTVGRR